MTYYSYFNLLIYGPLMLKVTDYFDLFLSLEENNDSRQFINTQHMFPDEKILNMQILL